MEDVQGKKNFNTLGDATGGASSPSDAEDLSAGVSGPVRRTARQVAEGAQELAGTVSEQGKRLVSQQARRSQERLAGSIRSVGEVLASAADRFHREGNDLLGNYVQNLADRLDHASDTVERQDLGSMVREIEGLARRRPALFTGAVFSLGFATARFLKSSSRKVHSVGRASGAGTLSRSPLYVSEARI